MQQVARKNGKKCNVRATTRMRMRMRIEKKGKKMSGNQVEKNYEGDKEICDTDRRK